MNLYFLLTKKWQLAFGPLLDYLLRLHSYQEYQIKNYQHFHLIFCAKIQIIIDDTDSLFIDFQNVHIQEVPAPVVHVSII